MATTLIDGPGLGYLNNRYHDPNLGVFISVDPLVQATGEPYIYARGNPTTLSDPTGLEPGCGQTAYSSTSCGDAHRDTQKQHLRNQDRHATADGIEYYAGCNSGSMTTFAGACTAADKMRAGSSLDDVRPYLVGLDPGSIIFGSEQSDSLLALLNVAAAGVFDATGALPDYFVLDVEFILASSPLAGIGGGGLVVVTRTGTVYMGPQLNLGTGGWSISGRAGYLAAPGPGWAPASGQDVDEAISGWSFSGSATSLPGFSRSVVIGLSGDSFPAGLSGAVSVELGVGTTGPFPVSYSMSLSHLSRVTTLPELAW